VLATMLEKTAALWLALVINKQTFEQQYTLPFEPTTSYTLECKCKLHHISNSRSSLFSNSFCSTLEFVAQLLACNYLHFVNFLKEHHVCCAAETKPLQIILDSSNISI